MLRRRSCYVKSFIIRLGDRRSLYRYVEIWVIDCGSVNVDKGDISSIENRALLGMQVCTLTVNLAYP